jgi:uncharacterized protein (DUF427 family)
MDRQPRQPEPGQESVWDYPRPPRLVETTRHLQVVFGGIVVAETQRAWRVLETSHPPVYYFPREECRTDLLVPAGSPTWCEWKGEATYYSLRVGDQEARRAVWTYADPAPAFTSIKDHLAFYPHLMDACYVDGERVQSQRGGFYGGWITKDIVGPFKGESGTHGW